MFVDMEKVGMGDDILSRITSNSEICGGHPRIRGMRIRVADVLETPAGGMTPEEILKDDPSLEREDISACLAYAARWLDHPVLRAS